MGEILLGKDGHTYKWVGDWAKMPAGKRFGYTHGVAEDKQGHILVFSTGPESMKVFDAEGEFVRSWGHYNGAHGLHYSCEAGFEYLYLTDPEDGFFCKTTLDGEVLWRLEYPQESGIYQGKEEFRPTNIAVSPNGDVYVADGYGKPYIHQYTKDAKYIRTWGGKGANEGQLDNPHGIWIDTRQAEPRVLVADRMNHRLQYFTLDGKYLSLVDKDVMLPCHFHQRGGDLLIPDLWGRVTIFDKDDRLAVHLGENPGIEKTPGWPNLPHAQRLPGKFISPHMAIWDREGNIFVVEWVEDGRVTKLERR